MLEIVLTRAPGRAEMIFRQAVDNPERLIVIGFTGLGHGDYFSLDKENRDKLRAWLDQQEGR